MSELEASVLIPVYNGARILPRCLKHWAVQEGARYEIVLVDNNSSDPSRELVGEFIDRASGRGDDGPVMRLFGEQRIGQSAATNRAIREASGEVLVFSAQDVAVNRDLLRGHLEAQRRYAPEGELVAVLGHIENDASCSTGHFMRCLSEETVFQFGYQFIGDPLNADPRCLYAPNFSIRRSALGELGVFDESFPYGWQDTDLGFRIRKAGGRIVYCPRLTVLHDHPWTWQEYCRRMTQVGHEIPRFLNKHPELMGRQDLSRAVRAHFIEGGRLASAAQKIALYADLNPGAELPPLEVEGAEGRDPLHAAYVILLKYHFHKGVYDGGRETWGADCWKNLKKEQG